MNEDIFGLVVRYSDDIFSEKIDTIDEHNKVINEKGYVYLGKFGRFIGKKNFEKLNDKTIKKNIILVKRVLKKYEFYISTVSSAVTTLENKDYVPKYYRNNNNITTWFKVEENFKKMSDDEISNWIIKSSKFSLRDSLSKSMSGYFIATIGKSINSSYKTKQKNSEHDFYYDSDMLNTDDDMDIDDLLDKFDI